ncbi:MAG: hypothetical protein ACYTGB_03600 [Planctomycetota bacterium]|jgi:hypothetical protein
MRLNGPLTAAAGVLLLLLTALHVRRLNELPGRVRLDSASAEIRGLAAAVRWRLERDLVLRDHNAPSTKRALEEAISDSPVLEWAALYSASGERLAVAGAAPDVAAEVQAGAGGRSDGQPEVSQAGADLVRGTTRIWIAQREMILAVGLRCPASELTGRVRALSLGTLAAGVTAGLLILIRGLAETAARGPGARGPSG